MAQISLRIPDDVIDDLKLVAETLGFSGYQPLIRFYIGQGLRKDIEIVETSRANLLITSLKKHGLSDAQIKEVLSESHTIPA